MSIRRLTPLLALVLLAACSGQRLDDGTAFHLGIPHIPFPHFGGGAQAARLEKTAEGNRPLQLWGDTTLGADCTPTGETRLEVTTPPSHGAVAIKPGRLYAVYPQGHPRAYCSGRLVTGVLAIYTAEQGYRGPDQAVLRGTTADGDVSVVTVNISVEAHVAPAPRSSRALRPNPTPSAPSPIPTAPPTVRDPNAPAPEVLRAPFPGG